MAKRGKVKYKDVVKRNHGGTGNKKTQKNNIKRKTYSLYPTSAKKNSNFKRKFDRSKVSEDVVGVKKQKIEEVQQSSSESEHEDEDNLTKLLSTFAGTAGGQKSLAIDSESDSDSEIDKNNENLNDEEVQDSLLEEESEGSLGDGDSEDETYVKDLNSANDQEEELKDHLDGSDSDSSTGNDSSSSKSMSKDGEVEEVSETEIEETADGQKENEEAEDAKDPFVKHLFYDLNDSLLESVQHTPMLVESASETYPELGSLRIQIPRCDDETSRQKPEFSISEERKYAARGEIPVRIDGSAGCDDLFIKTQIGGRVKKANKSVLTDSEEIFTALQAEIFSVINNYQDFYYPGRTFGNAEEIRYVYCLHLVNHVLKTRLKVLHHNAKLSKKDNVPEDFRDQGLARPKVLIILPFKDAAYRTVQTIIDIILPENTGNVMNKKRFTEEYTGEELSMPKKNPKPEDYEQIFRGNTSDEFKIGITVTKKSLKLYADFYSSDIIIASPLGLRTVIGAEGEPDRDYDFLASVELLILDQTEMFLVQNWDHLLHVFNHLHLQPKKSHGTDFSRVRTWSLNGWSKYYRQTLIFSSLVLPEINGIFNRKCQNYAGKVRVANPVDLGCIGQVYVQLPHVFHRFDANNAADAIDARFDIFVKKILAQQRETLMKQTLIYIPNYFDYVRIRNFFKREDIGFVQICEYSKEAKIARARDMFFHGDAHFMLYTERYHFFNRKRIKGIRHIVFYQPPNFPHFYYEMCNLMQEANMNKKIGNTSNMTVSVIYSKCDVHQLSAIVGTDRAAKMVKSDRKVHMMVTGGD